MGHQCRSHLCVHVLPSTQHRRRAARMFAPSYSSLFGAAQTPRHHRSDQGRVRLVPLTHPGEHGALSVHHKPWMQTTGQTTPKYFIYSWADMHHTEQMEDWPSLFPSPLHQCKPLAGSRAICEGRDPAAAISLHFNSLNVHLKYVLWIRTSGFLLLAAGRQHSWIPGGCWVINSCSQGNACSSSQVPPVETGDRQPKHWPPESCCQSCSNSQELETVQERKKPQTHHARFYLVMQG